MIEQAGIAPTLPLELAVLPFVGLASMIVISMSTAVCTEETAPEYRGRVMALIGVAFLGSTPIDGPLVGWVARDLGPRAGLAVGAVTALIAGCEASRRSLGPWIFDRSDRRILWSPRSVSAP